MGVGRLIAEHSDQLILDDLQVHPAVEAGGSLGLLPAYVEREHDGRLRELIAAAREGQSGIAVLVGESSTGKTRSCWEAVKALPRDWRLWHPIEPDHAKALITQLDDVKPHTVVWLDEIRRYLLDNREHSAEVAARLRALLADSTRSPVLVLATMWPQDWDVLHTMPGLDAGPDLHANARQLVKGKGIEVRPAFTADELATAHELAAGDPRLGESLARAEQGQITQYLAGAPALLERYQHAPAAAKALLHVAMDARRLGHVRDLPLPLLEAAVPGYLTDRQWDALPENWLRTAVDYLTDQAACRGARSPLYRPRPRGRRSTNEQPGYQLADYLEQHGHTTRRGFVPRSEFWDAVALHANGDDLIALAESAENRCRTRIAFELYRRAAEAGSIAAWRPMIQIRREQEDHTAVEALTREAADAGSPGALLRVAAEMVKNDLEAAEQLAWRAYDAGDPEALLLVAHQHLEAGEHEKGSALLHTVAQKVISQGVDNPFDVRDLSVLLESAGERELAATVALTLAPRDHASAVDDLVKHREDAGNPDAAEELAWRAADIGATGALWGLVRQRDLRDHDAAMALAQRVRGEDRPPWPQVRELEARGDQHAAETLAVRSAAVDSAIHYSWWLSVVLATEKQSDEGESPAPQEDVFWFEEYFIKPSALDRLISLFEQRDPAAATALALSAAIDNVSQSDADPLNGISPVLSQAVTGLVHLMASRERAGEHEAAEQLAWQLVEAGHGYALEPLVLLREEENPTARHTLMEKARRGTLPAAWEWLADQHDDAGELDTADDLALRAAYQGHPSAARELADRRSKAGDNHRAERLWRQLAELGATDAWEELAKLHTKARNWAEAESCARKAIDRGSSYAILALHDVWEGMGHPDADRLLFGLDAEGRASARW
ncbi:hypothetical protein AB4039_04625 [Streptomyces sp. M-16]|uniref:hypothetical protein n=1 Tax=Streptomyces sp. M-16 TaxID=3233040 RepID=UPI003F9DC0B3